MSAVISPCELYRYELERVVCSPGIKASTMVTFIGVNPSTADATLDDPTIRKCQGFAYRWRFARFTMVNLFAFRSTDVRRLADEADPVGPRNDEHLRWAMARADLVVPCWGNSGKLPPRLRGRVDEVRAMIRSAGRPTHALGYTKSGDPRHPLMLGYSTPLIPWTGSR